MPGESTQCSLQRSEWSRPVEFYNTRVKCSGCKTPLILRVVSTQNVCEWALMESGVIWEWTWGNFNNIRSDNSQAGKALQYLLEFLSLGSKINQCMVKKMLTLVEKPPISELARSEFNQEMKWGITYIPVLVDRKLSTVLVNSWRVKPTQELLKDQVRRYLLSTVTWDSTRPHTAKTSISL